MNRQQAQTTAAALALFREGYNCAQAVVHAFAAEAGLDRDRALKIACGLGGGFGRAQEICGALAGATLVLGWRHGRGLGEPKDKSEETYARVRALLDGFTAAHGACRCRDLLEGCDLDTEAGQAAYRDRGYRAGRCEAFIAEVVAFLAADRAADAPPR